MKEKIIETAGKIWRFLGEHGETTLPALIRGCAGKDEIVYQALGWLAREDKINYKGSGKAICVSLVDQEIQAFKAAFPAFASKSANGKAKKSGINRIKAMH